MTDFTPQFEDLPNAPIREALASEARQDFEQPLSYRAQGIHERFQALAEEWHEATDDLSGTAVFMHPAYQQIIGMGPVVLPLLFRDLAETESHWFWALRVITNENPVPPEHRGRVDRMTSTWLSWGMRNNLP
ncbi:hypothetical protein BH24GEM2_BH24GEM2_10810 [soil metagenome]